MTLVAGDQLDLSIEKPAAGGRMIARHEGQVILVQGAVPGERVRVRVQRTERQVAFARAIEILEPSMDRRAAEMDLACGGCWYAHIAYRRQLALKAEVIQDAFARLGRIVLPSVDVAGSPERGYRMRARLHARGARVGFYREGTHDLCDAAATGQLSEAASDAARGAGEWLAAAGCDVVSLELAENVAGDQRAIHAELRTGAVTAGGSEALRTAASASGVSVRNPDGVVHAAGEPSVSDPLSLLTDGRAAGGMLRRRAESFFQANRFLLPRLVTAVCNAVPGTGEVLDLYAGVGLFALSLGASGRADVTAIEGDRTSGADLRRNAAENGGAVRAVVGSVEEYLRRRKGRSAATVIVDPPRTGISRAALSAILDQEPGRIVYVSCDPPTMARDGRRLLDAGYGLTSLCGFDLFPNTPHVEALGIFDRR